MSLAYQYHLLDHSTRLDAKKWVSFGGLRLDEEVYFGNPSTYLAYINGKVFFSFHLRDCSALKFRPSGQMNSLCHYGDLNTFQSIILFVPFLIKFWSSQDAFVSNILIGQNLKEWEKGPRKYFSFLANICEPKRIKMKWFYSNDLW